MLTLVLPEREFFDDAKGEFVNSPQVTLTLEHSLVSLSKWESFWEKPFLTDEPKTDEQAIDYIRCMNLAPEVPPETFSRLLQSQMDTVADYIDKKMTATWFNEGPTKGHPTEVVTAEIIYFWMIALNVPFECQDWHLNRLLTLIKVCNQKNQPDKPKMSQAELMARNRALNEERRKRWNTSG